MEKTILKKIKIKLPASLADSLSRQEIVSMISDKALGKAEYYLSRCKIFQEKYGMNLSFFKKKMAKQKKEKYSEWDDIILCEGYEEAYKQT